MKKTFRAKLLLCNMQRNCLLFFIVKEKCFSQLPKHFDLALNGSNKNCEMSTKIYYE